jgi:hypothetical protein
VIWHRFAFGRLLLASGGEDVATVRGERRKLLQPFDGGVDLIEGEQVQTFDADLGVSRRGSVVRQSRHNLSIFVHCRDDR